MRYLTIVLLFAAFSLQAQWKPYIQNDYTHAVSVGFVPGASTETKYGYNLDIDTGEEDIWSAGGSITYLSSAEPMLIVSSSDADSTGNTGALTMRLIGLDADYNAIEDTITLDGTNNVESLDTFLRVTRAYVLTAGSGGKNAGNITITAKSAATTQAYIPANYGQTQQCLTTVKAGETCYVVGGIYSTLKTSGGTSPKVQFLWNYRPNGGAWRVLSRVDLDVAANSLIANQEVTQFALSEKSDIRVSAVTDSDNTVATARIYMVCYDNDN